MHCNVRYGSADDWRSLVDHSWSPGTGTLSSDTGRDVSDPRSGRRCDACFHEATARKGAQQIIAACEAYKRQTGRLPARLEQLVTAFLPKVPLAKYTLLYNDFWYISQSGMLTYVVLPPFGRRVYDFSTARWNYLD